MNYQFVRKPNDKQVSEYKFQKVLRVISDEDGTLNPAEDPFDGEIRTLGSDLDVNQAMQQIFNDFSNRPSFAKIDTEKYRDVVKIIKGKIKASKQNK